MGKVAQKGTIGDVMFNGNDHKVESGNGTKPSVQINKPMAPGPQASAVEKAKVRPT